MGPGYHEPSLRRVRNPNFFVDVSMDVIPLLISNLCFPIVRIDASETLYLLPKPTSMRLGDRKLWYLIVHGLGLPRLDFHGTWYIFRFGQKTTRSDRTELFDANLMVAS